ncbi:hypothetical protein AB0N07_25610 [Streptomyces sp. NPDC051172]|uniref:hypothetical protein n=1 Tax=Streptomyces sp. NPDC051172 TaxID=3155796 RepID=UPI0034425746
MTIDQTTHQPVRRPSVAAVPSAEDSEPVALTAPLPPAGEDEIDGAEPHIVRGTD